MAYKISDAVSICVLFIFIILGVKSDNVCDTEMVKSLQQLLAQQDNPSIQLQSLRNQLRHILQDALDKIDDQDEQEEAKRSISSLAHSNNLPTKRNLEALARAGYIKTLPDESTGDDNSDNNDANYKRSLAVLAKNGQLPIMMNDDQKRGIESLARNGDLNRHNGKDIQDMLMDLYQKRSVASLARNYNFPSYGKRFIGALARNGDLNYQYKRNIASLAKNGGFLQTNKRNVAALLRQDQYYNTRHQDGRTDVPEIDKKNIASIKAQYGGMKYKRDIKQETRKKREVMDLFDVNDNSEYPVPVYQNQNGYDYEELMKQLTGSYPNTEKRFLGSVARSGWFRPTNSRQSRFNSPEKRHIGSLARLGWLPTYRSVRRFNRSGRSTDDEECRTTSTSEQTENNKITTHPNSIALLNEEDKRFLVQPAVNNILLHKLFMMQKQKDQ